MIYKKKIVFWFQKNEEYNNEDREYSEGGTENLQY